MPHTPNQLDPHAAQHRDIINMIVFRCQQLKQHVMITINIPSEQGLVIVATQSIIRIEALNNYSRIIFRDRKPLVVAKVLHWFEDKLPEQTFWRIHKSHLVNCSYIEKINAGWSGSSVLMSSGEAINVSRRKRWLLNNAKNPLPAQRAA